MFWLNFRAFSGRNSYSHDGGSGRKRYNYEQQTETASTSHKTRERARESSRVLSRAISVHHGNPFRSFPIVGAGT